MCYLKLSDVCIQPRHRKSRVVLVMQVAAVFTAHWRGGSCCSSTPRCVPRIHKYTPKINEAPCSDHDLFATPQTVEIVQIDPSTSIEPPCMQTHLNLIPPVGKQPEVLTQHGLAAAVHIRHVEGRYACTPCARPRSQCKRMRAAPDQHTHRLHAPALNDVM